MATTIDGVLVTATEVKELFVGESQIADQHVNNFINAAHVIVSDITGLSDDRTKQIELWLSAHLLALVDKQIRSESFGGDYSVTYLVGQLGSGFKSTFYGQTAVSLDQTGTLQKADSKKATFISVAKKIDDEAVSLYE